MMDKTNGSEQAKKKKLGFTNRLAIYILLFLAAGLIGGFVLAWRSITYGYTGALMCWSVVFTPIGTAVSIVLTFIVQKSRAENTGANGEGIVYATALANTYSAGYEVNNCIYEELAVEDNNIDSVGI